MDYAMDNGLWMKRGLSNEGNGHVGMGEKLELGGLKRGRGNEGELRRGQGAMPNGYIAMLNDLWAWA